LVSPLDFNAYIRNELFNLQDCQYKSFHQKLIPNINPDTILGVRTPILKRIVKENKNNCGDFLDSLPHEYYEENNIHAFLINEIADFEQCIRRVEQFLPYVDNWATCDGLRPKCFGSNTDKLLPYIEKWLRSDKCYTVRFGIEMLMLHYLGDNFDNKYLQKVSKIQSDEYYVNMMIAWFFATALSKQYDKAVTIIENSILPLWIHNKTIQKAVESYRIAPEQKEYLVKLRRKNNG